MKHLARVRTYQHVVIWISLLTIFTALDWPIERMSVFWRDHSFISGIISGVLLLGLGLFVVEAWFKSHEAKKWQQVSFISCKELGYMCDVLLSGMEHLLNGQHRNKDGVYYDEDLLDRIDDLLESKGLLNNDPLNHEARLRILLEDSAWVRLAAFEALDTIKHQHRRNIALYVPIMLTTDKMADLLNETGVVNQMVFGLQDMMRVLLKSEDRILASPEVKRFVLNVTTTRELSAEEETQLKNVDLWKEATFQQWKLTVYGIINLQQEFMREAGNRSWVNPKQPAE